MPSSNVRASATLCPMRWGLVPSWWKRPLKDFKIATFNARAGTVKSKAMFRNPFRQKRCLIPASGYYEWESNADRKAAVLLLN